jgi:hypothetical protein
MLFLSCVKTLKLSVPSHEPKLVLHGYIGLDSAINVAIGKTFPSNITIDDTSTYIKNAWVLLYENGVFSDSLRYNDRERRYISQRVALKGKMYTIVAGADGFETVEASAIAPLPIKTIAIAHVKNARTDSYGMLLDDVKFTVNDPATETNYYLAALNPAGPAPNYMCVSTFDPVIEKPTRDLIPIDEECINNDEIIFTDQSFNGSLKEITISGETQRLKTITAPSSGNVYRPWLKVYNISKDYYRYLKNTISIEIDPEIPSLTEPVAVKGNVKNGYGLFTIFTVTTDTLR